MVKPGDYVWMLTDQPPEVFSKTDIPYVVMAICVQDGVVYAFDPLLPGEYDQVSIVLFNEIDVLNDRVEEIFGN